MNKQNKINFVCIILLVLVIVLAGSAATSAHVYGGLYNSLNVGVVWSWGGFEIYPSLGFFLCADGISTWMDTNFTNIVADC